MATRKTVAVVDDDGSVRDALSGLVRSIGMAAVGFSSADDFVAALQSTPIDCVITDVQMPGMDGMDLLQVLCGQRRGIPVIVMTAYPSAARQACALASGAAHFLGKPFNGGEMVRCIEQALVEKDK